MGHAAEQHMEKDKESIDNDYRRMEDIGGEIK